MGLLDKQRKSATKRGLAVAILAGLIAGLIFGWLWEPPVDHSLGRGIYWAIVGAVTIGAIYWQGLPD
jgi:hypothetical protein